MNPRVVTLLLALACLGLPELCASEAHVKEIASRYDLVGRVTRTTLLKWNTNPERKWSLRMFPVDPKKVPGGSLYVGIAHDGDPDFPYFGDIFVKGMLFGYNELFVRVRDVKNSEMRAIDDGGNEYLIQVVRRGSGYKRK